MVFCLELCVLVRTENPSGRPRWKTSLVHHDVHVIATKQGHFLDERECNLPLKGWQPCDKTERAALCQNTGSHRVICPGHTPRYVKCVVSRRASALCKLRQPDETGSQVTQRENQNTKAHACRLTECQKVPLVFSQMPEKINVSEAHILPGKGVFTGLSRFICARASRATRSRDIMSPISTGRIKKVWV